MTVLVIGPGQKVKGKPLLDVTSRSAIWSKELSPFFLGPCPLYGKFNAVNMENAWQYAKVYPEFLSETGEILPTYKEWSTHGWKLKRAVRYPMGQGAVPAFSLWDGERLDYIQARKKIYIPLYREAVKKTRAWKLLKLFFEDKKEIVLFDFDGHGDSRTLRQVLNDPTKKMGHGYVLAMMLLYGEDFDPEFLP